MERETITLQTPVQNHTVTVYSYLTGRELEHVMYGSMSGMKVKDAEQEGIAVEKAQEFVTRLLTKLVVSVDGKLDNLHDAILDMHSTDYQYIVGELTEYLKKK